MTQATNGTGHTRHLNGHGNPSGTATEDSMTTVKATPHTGTRTAAQPAGLSFTREFSSPSVHPFDEVGWRKTTATIKDEGGAVIFSQEVEAPESWSEQAVKVVASKYFYGDIAGGDDPAKGGRESSVRQLVGRVAGTIARWGREDGYFAGEDDGDSFEDDLTWLLLNQHGSFNSPVWFNVGLSAAYGIRGAANGWVWREKRDRMTGERTHAEARRCDDAYVNPQCSACFIVKAADDMESILERAKTEGMLFKYGSGVGADNSTIRSTREKLSSGGRPSGPVSFMRIYDAVAGQIKSGGAVRRAAKMETLKDWHPDILEFAGIKAHEDRKAKALVDAGYSGGMNGEASATVGFQNSNLSVRCSDKFLQAVEAGGDWTTRAVTTGDDVETFPAARLMDAIAGGTWVCGDPGIQYEDTIQRWHTCPNTAPINSSNPCQPGFATVLTPYGIRTFDDIGVGSIIWGGQRWTRVTRKVATGIKPVNRYETTAGAFIGTAEHQVISGGKRVQAQHANSIDRCVGPDPVLGEIDRQDVVDGWVFGDGSIHKASNDLVHFHLGKDDGCFHDDYGDFIIRRRDGLGPYAWEVNTTIMAEELPKTYKRIVPDRFRMGDPAKIRGFLRGLYAANGSVCGGRVTLKAASHDVIFAVQEMLSAMGIRSYVTCNKPSVVAFANGSYECKESYDLNITVDRAQFAQQIGFVHPHKSEKLARALETRPSGKIPKTKYAINDVVELGEFPVYDITVEDSDHVYWTGGMLVSNCSEYMFIDSSACNLASLNLMKFRDPGGSFNVDRFRAACRVFLVAQEILVDRSSYPTAMIAENSHKFRPLGLGYCGLGALLMSAGLPYDSDEGRSLAGAVTAIMHGQANLTSAEMAGEFGAFEGYAVNAEPMMAVMRMHNKAAWDGAWNSSGNEESSEIVDLWDAATEIWGEVVITGDRHGFRNSQVTVLAPTGTIAFMMDSGHSTGMEPSIGLVQYKTLAGGGQLKIVNPVVEIALKGMGYGLEIDRSCNGDTDRYDRLAAVLSYIDKHDTIEDVAGTLYGSPLHPEHLPVFDCAFSSTPNGRSISWMGHVKMMGALQPFLSGAISKTVNLPREATVDDIREAYLEAWRLGVKAVAIFRDGSKESQPVSTSKTTTPVKVADRDEVKDVYGEGVAVGLELGRKEAAGPRRSRLPDTRSAVTHKLSVGGVEAYLTVGEFPDGRPGELFVSMAKEGSTLGGLMDAWATAVSIMLQYGIPVDVIVNKFAGGRFEPAGMTRNPSEIPIASSLIDYVARWLGMRYVAGYREAYAPRGEGYEGSIGGGGTEAIQDGLSADVPAPAERPLQVAATASHGPLCGVCGGMTVPTGRCWTCNSCGTSVGGCG